ncbi:MAG: hypothetical protein M0Q13_14980 [Methanothrix sp.]|jgi:hypothetical protein|nr:hypothetical protein [Methanothrix sp.]
MHAISLDSIDIALLAAIKARPGQHMAEVLRGFTLLRESQSYDRIRRLAAWGFVELDRTSQRGKVFCNLTEAGRKALAGARPCTQ